MKSIINILTNRNFILLGALTFGLSLPEIALYLKNSLIWVLAIVMIFSVSGIDFKSLTNFKQVAAISAVSIFMNFIVFGIILLTLSFLFFDDETIRAGFIVIAATPPGIAIIPFSVTFKGNLKFALTGIIGSYFAAIILSPLIITVLTDAKNLDPSRLIYTIIIVVVLPLLFSRLLRIAKIYPITEKIRGKVIDFGFAIIIYVSVGLNRNLLFSNTDILLYSGIIFFITMFISGFLFSYLFAKKISRSSNISYNLMLTIKSSGFAAATSITLFDTKAALPAAILSIFMLLYLLFADLWLPKGSVLSKYIFRKHTH